MADNTDIPGPQDRETINRNQPHEVKYWAQKFGVTEQQLLQAISTVGPKVGDVRRYLKK
ncbi:DUF3606 domain-containing protein [Sorangium sp. So ce1014]|uniref:DUF3606 domain-containing protein n=1 Tax=Sorangium sp. So ce1014 TaxID=3133326 RepID=UPI003F5DE16B